MILKCLQLFVNLVNILKKALLLARNAPLVLNVPNRLLILFVVQQGLHTHLKARCNALNVLKIINVLLQLRHLENVTHIPATQLKVMDFAF